MQTAAIALHLNTLKRVFMGGVAHPSGTLSIEPHTDPCLV